VGLSTRWKRAVAYFLTSKADPTTKEENLVGQAMADIVFEVVRLAESIGLRCILYLSDMGPENRAMWKALQVGLIREGRAIFSVQHPTRPMCKFWILPDTVHLFKNILPCLSHNKEITLPDDIVKEEGLSTNKVTLKHLDGLRQFESEKELKIAYRLDDDTLHCRNQYNKMNVSSPSSVFNIRTVAALLKKAEEEKDESIKTTAFFVHLVWRWFDYVSYRGGKMALRKFTGTRDEDGNKVIHPEYQKALDHLKRTADIFSRMTVGPEKERKNREQKTGREGR